MTLWGGRFESSMDETLWRLSESFSFDRALYRHDIIGTKAHIEGLHKAGIITGAELGQMVSALDTVTGEFDNGTFVRHASDEDIHMAIERRVTELLGPLGAKLHTGRSRNDQVATTLRLFTRDALTDVAETLLTLIQALRDVADEHPTLYLPGYTHMQRAQPVLLSHHLQAHAFAFLRDIDRAMDARDRLLISPLGAGAIAGTSLPLDPHYTAQQLGFRRAFANSMDATSDRDFVAEALFVLALIGVHFSRLGEELVLWTTSEFGFASLGDSFTTGSSMLPQKKNSDVAELARGKSGRLVGNLTGLLTMLKGLPLAYNRDLQEDKEPLFDSLRTVTTVGAALAGAYQSLTFHGEVMAAAADDELLVAIDIAESLVSEGLPFREAHERVGSLVGEAVRSGVTLESLVRGDSELVRFVDLFIPGTALERRCSPGASGPQAYRVQGYQLAGDVDTAERRVRGS
jgi:argininosuccinate lyase